MLHRDPKTIRECLKKYRDGGLKAVYEYEKHKHESELDPYGELIEKELDQRPPRSAKEAGAIIEKLTGIKRSETQVRAFLKKKKREIAIFIPLGWRSPQKTRFPAKLPQIFFKIYQTGPDCRTWDSLRETFLRLITGGIAF